MSSIRLPLVLREEIDSLKTSDCRRECFQRGTSRKEIRKECRANRKKNKAQFFKSHASRMNLTSKSAQFSIKNENQTTAFANAEEATGRSYHIKSSASSIKRPKSTTISKKNLRNSSQSYEEEDSYITYLESKFGYREVRKKKNYVDDDGLDDLLNFADAIYGPKIQNEVMNLGRGSDVSPYSDNFLGSECLDDSDDWQGIFDEAQEEEMDTSSEAIENSLCSEKPPAMGRLGQESNPHHQGLQDFRQKDNGNSLRLSRQLKGLLNRLTEQNLPTILKDVEGIYRNYRRHDVTTIVTNLIIDTTASHSMLLDSYVVLHAAFVSSLHKIVGMEFVANFLHCAVSRYEQHYAAMKNFQTQNTSLNENTNGKQCLNLIVLLSELYNFRVVSSVLIYDILRGILEDKLSEYSIDLLCKIIKISGRQLQQDDSSSLEEITEAVRGVVSERGNSLSSRIRFMIESLFNVKNNKLKTDRNQGVETVDRMKKFLTGLSNTRNVCVQEPLCISLQDIRSADTKGKWWLVGASPASDPLFDGRVKNAIEVTTRPSSRLESLSRKQGMNTDIRRSIFFVLMSSDDYISACNRLMQLKLTEVQQREIVRVALHCCGNEKSYNPYYALICQHLCRMKHSYKITLQFYLWDFLRDFGEASIGGLEVIKTVKESATLSDVGRISPIKMRNVAKAYAWWIAKDCLMLTVLKPVDFTSLREITKKFLFEMLLHIFIYSQHTNPTATSSPNAPLDCRALENIFSKVAILRELAMGLIYFMTDTFRAISCEDPGLTTFIQWASDVAKARLRVVGDIQ